MQEWLAVRPGGQQTLVLPASVPRWRSLDIPPTLSRNSSTHHFKQTLKNSKWKVVRGFHALRHTFGSNLVRTGKVPPGIVGRWMGHTTEEMREHYQHLFPQDGVHQIGVLR
jgi:integrase